MPIKSTIVLFATINLMTATTLWFVGFQGIRELIHSGHCGEVCAYINIAFGATGLSEELVLVTALLLSVIHLIGGLAAIRGSECGLTIFASTYVIRFLILLIDTSVKSAVGPHKWTDLLFMVDHNQSEMTNDFRFCVTFVQLCLVFWSVALIWRFRTIANQRIKRQSLNLVLQSWLIDNNAKSFR